MIEGCVIDTSWANTTVHQLTTPLAAVAESISLEKQNRIVYFILIDVIAVPVHPGCPVQVILKIFMIRCKQIQDEVHTSLRWKIRGAFSCVMFAALFFVSCDNTIPEKELDAILTVRSVDPLEKIFKETSVFNAREPLAHVARGEHATIQYVVRPQCAVSSLTAQAGPLINGADTLADIRIGYIGYVHVGRNTPSPSRDKLVSASGLYPDPIIEKESIDIDAGETQPVWITVTVPIDAGPGLYSGELTLSGTINGSDFSKKVPLQVRVYPVTIDKTSLWVTNWYSASPHNLELVFGEKDIPRYSEKYWEYIRLLAQKMAEYRQNVAIISPLQLSEYSLDERGNYVIDFSNFDRTVDIFMDEGVLGRIEGGHIGGREGGWISDFVVSVPIVENGAVTFKSMSIREEDARKFYRAFIPSLTKHLAEKGWDKIYMQHLMDEPIPENVDTYIEIANFIRQLGPELKIVEACHSKDVGNSVQIWVPQLDYMDIDYEFYKKRAAAGDEIWFYTCLNPKGEYANRFVELPLIKTRILHWINFRYNIPGYLHWGLNFWNNDPYRESTGIQLESGTILPGGDAWIVYPGDRKLYSSIRLEAMRDGIVDYELLKMLEERYPEEAAELARQVVYRFDYYDINVDAFREKRIKILTLLSEASL